MAVGMDQMGMVFFHSLSTPLFSRAWTPSDPAAYAATCVFVLVMGVIHRLLVAFRNIVFEEARAMGAAARCEKTGPPPPADEDETETTACLGHGGAAGEMPQARRIPPTSVGAVRAFCELTIVLVSYLL
ncbi:Ctr copper transporter [Apiospora kogelbergensis]|uniref:Copper transport protein n=1 Tax=Apiospora kogelbergensis TaxID=1337665 RepID=A0AAW0R241_9PEZI